MKKMNIFLAALLCMMMQTMSAVAHEKLITTDKLPATAKAFVQQTFPGQMIEYAIIDADFSKTTYEICLNNGVEMEFDINGEWYMVDCNYDPVPQQLIPAVIANFVSANYSDQTIVKIDKENGGYSIDLSNDVEIKFDSNGQVIEVSD